jgi:hypothetical protein
LQLFGITRTWPVAPNRRQLPDALASQLNLGPDVELPAVMHQQVNGQRLTEGVIGQQQRHRHQKQQQQRRHTPEEQVQPLVAGVKRWPEAHELFLPKNFHGLRFRSRVSSLRSS